MQSLPKEVLNLVSEIDTSKEWHYHMAPIINNANWTQPQDLRVGQKLMNALSMAYPGTYKEIAGSPSDIWEVSSKNDPRIKEFFWFLFESFVKGL